MVQYKQSGGQVWIFKPVTLALPDLYSLTFRWLAIPYFQEELDQYVKLNNTTQRRANKHKVLPQGIPEQMFRYPHSVGALDFKVYAVKISIINQKLMPK